MCLIRSVELFHFCVIACDGNAIFTGRIRMGKQSWNRTTNQMNCNNNKNGIKEWNRNVLSPTYRQSARVYFWNSCRQVLFNEWKQNKKSDGFGVNVSSWILQLLYFICQISLQFVVHFCIKCIVSFCYKSPIEWLTFRQPIYIIFLNRKPVIGLLRLVFIFFFDLDIQWTPYKSDTWLHYLSVAFQIIVVIG